MKQIFFSIVGLLLVSCNQSRKLTESEITHYLTLGDSIASQAQKVLLMNVSAKMKEGGAVRAVDFCSEKAVFLTDSLSNKHHIQRISDKNRNPNNFISSELDQKAWNDMATLMQSSGEKHLILQDKDDVYYYKAIPLAMPTCLACHGNTQTDIAPETFQILAEKYPNDKATNYKMGELRGLWKIKIGD